MGFDIKCTVETCNNTSEQSGKIMCFYAFPKDPELRQQWLQKCGKDGSWNDSFSYVCSEHFTKDGFEAPKEQEEHDRKELQPTALPTLNVLTEIGLEIKEKSEAPSGETVKNEQAVTNEEDERNSASPAFVSEETYNDLLKVYQRLSHCNNNLKKHLRVCRQSVDVLTRQIKQLEVELAESNRKYETECKNSKKFEKAMTYFFGMAQESFKTTKSDAKWSSEELIQTMTIRYLSRRCYDFLCENLYRALPDMDSLQKWLANINVREGILDDYLCIMHIVSKDMTEEDRAIVLHIAQAKVTSLYEYDATNDNVLKPCSTALVIVAAGMFSKWKQPIYLSFDTAVTQNLLNDLMDRLENMSYSIVACVSDYNENVAQLWTELNLTKKNTYFRHPITDNKVYWFVEAAYLLKNTHYIFVMDGFRMNDGHNVNVEPLRELLTSKRDTQRYRSNIDPTHLVYFEEEPPKLRPAEAVFNCNTAFDLSVNYSGTDKTAAVTTANFIDAVSRWYTVATRQEYGSSLQEQKLVLSTAYNLLSGIVVAGDDQREALQRAFLTSIHSLKAFPIDLWGKYDTTYTIQSERVCKNEAVRFFSPYQDEELEDMTPLNIIMHLKSLTLHENPYRGEFLTGKLLSSMPPLRVTVTEYSPSQAFGNISSIVYNEADEVRYLISAVAEKFLDTNPQLGTRTRVLSLQPPYVDVSINMCSFVESSDAWRAQARQLNLIFEAFHNQKLVTGPRMTQILVDIVHGMYPDADMEVVKYFLTERLLLRMKYLNAGLVEASKTEKEADDLNK